MQASVFVCRYGEAVRDIIRLKRDYRKGCTAAIALQLFDEFPIADFCLPLLLCNDTTGMEEYLAGSVLLYRLIFFTGTPLKVLSVRLHSKLTKSKSLTYQ